jgi:hypothetical protein
MEKVTVHEYLTWDHRSGRSVVARAKATVERIGLVGGKVVPGTAEEVDPSALDGGGRYVPRKA